MIKYRLLDWQLNKTFYVKECFSLTPSMGACYAWVNNQNNITYSGFAIATNFPGVQNKVQLINNFKGWGLIGGFNSNGLLGMGFEVFGKAAFSGLFGKLDFRHIQNLIEWNNLS